MTNEVLASAIEKHRAGQWAEAAALYQTVLAADADNADALHLLGVLHHQQGDNARAVTLISRAVAIQPSSPAFHANLAEAYRGLGEMERAAGSCRAALQLWPDYPEALCNLGAALQGLGQHEDSLAPLRRAVELRPDFAVAHNNLAIALRETNAWDEAQTHFLRAVELDPQFAMARSNLGQLLLDQGHAEEALPHCEQAVRLQPNVAALHHNLGHALRRLQRLIDARAAYLEALRLDPKLAKSHSHLGRILHSEGKYRDALPWQKQAVELEPANAQYWELLAETNAELEEFGEALRCWQQAHQLDPDRVSVRLGLGWSLQEDGRLDEAVEHFRAAVRLQPDSSLAHVHLGGWHEEQGALADAEAAFRQALAVDPGFALPYARLGTLLRGKLPAEDRAALEEHLATSPLGPGPRARLLFSLAHVLDAQGEFARAAELLREANQVMLEITPDRRDYNMPEHEQFVGRVMNVFDGEHFRRTAGFGNESRRPVFVFGLPRSGTTLVEQVLASHSQVHGAGELRYVRQMFESLPSALGRTEWPIECCSHLEVDDVARLSGRHLERLQALDGGTFARVVDKMPDNYMYLGLIATLFPNAVLIHCRRNLRDVAVSLWMTDFRSIRWANDQAHIAHRVAQYLRLMDHWQRTLPIPIHHIDYDALVADLEPEARKLIAASGLEWEPGCLEFHRLNRPVRTASVTQVRQPVYTRSVARWKNYERELADLFAALPVSADGG